MKGIGKPAPSGALQGEYSRRINEKDRLVYQTTLQTYVHDTKVMAARSVDLFEQATDRKTS